jgi:hypothetical protein
MDVWMFGCLVTLVIEGRRRESDVWRRRRGRINIILID